jgi:hypothetical protein
MRNVYTTQHRSSQHYSTDRHNTTQHRSSLHYTAQVATTLHSTNRHNITQHFESPYDVLTLVMATGENLDAEIWNPARAYDTCVVIPDV